MSRRPDLLMIGPYPKDYIHGGIEAVISSYLSSSILDKYNIKYISTSCEAHLFQKIMAMIICLFKSVCSLFFMNIKIVHIHMAAWGSFHRKMICVYVAKVFKKKTILHIHGSEFNKFYDASSKFTQWLITKVFNSVDLILVLSDRWINHIQAKTCNKNIKILFNPVNTSLYSFRPLTNQKGRETKDIVFVGTLCKRKGIYDLLLAMPIILKKEPSTRLILCGDGDLDNCKRICKEKNVSDHIVFCGWVQGQKKIDIICNADVFVLPSYNEGLPVSIIEAMSASLPIVSTYVGGIPDIIKDDVNGFLVQPGNVKAIADRIIQLLENEPLRIKMGQQNAMKANTLFGIDVVIKQLCQIYQKL